MHILIFVVMAYTTNGSCSCRFVLLFRLITDESDRIIDCNNGLTNSTYIQGYVPLSDDG